MPYYYDALHAVEAEKIASPGPQGGLEYFPHSDKEYVPPEKEVFAVSHDQVDSTDAATRKTQFCGLRRRTCLILAVIVTVIVIAAVGGGVGGSLASKSRNVDSPAISSLSPTVTSSSSATSISTTSMSVTSIGGSSVQASATTIQSSRTSSSSSSSSSPTSTSTSSALMGSWNCPADNGTQYSSPAWPSRPFTILCNADFIGTGVDGTPVVDLDTGVVAHSIDECIDQCAANNRGGGGCLAVAYGANITLALSRGGITGNCFLKTQRTSPPLKDNTGQAMAAYA